LVEAVSRFGLGDKRERLLLKQKICKREKMSQKTQKATFKVLISLVIFFFTFALAMADNAVAEELTGPPEGKVPSVEAEEVEEGVPLFQEGEDKPLPRPTHPPIHQIPPMPMPAEPPQGRGMPLEPGVGIIHDLKTGKTITVPNNLTIPNDTLMQDQGGGYSGADGGGGIENLLTSFGTMIRIESVEDFPWRMNVKLVMRFGSDWYVCSGTMRDAEVILTAGHCVYDYDGEGWADEIYVYPAYDGDTFPIGAYGYGYASRLGSWTGWTEHGDLNYDIGVIEIQRAVGMLTGWFGWTYGGSCDWHLSTYYYNASYPRECCNPPSCTLHNGKDMYFWSGYWYSCPTWNRLRLDTTPGCFTAAWGGMSGSGAYYIDNGNRYVHAVASTSDRAYWAEYTRQWEDWVNWCNNTFIPDARGSAFDLQALDVNAQPESIEQGGSTTLLNHLATNPTNGSKSGTWYFNVYLSTNDNISTSDTLLSTQYYSWNFGAMNSVRVNMVPVTIPYNTPPGDYWIGVIYDAATDGNYDNNDTDGWDAVPIHVTAETTPPNPDPMTWATEPYTTGTSSISMVATAASDPTPPIEYYFDFYGSPTSGSGGNDSGWQSSTSYTDSGLNTNHQYTYRVRARDGNDNRTSYSILSSAYTLANTPGTPTVDNPTYYTLDVTINPNGNPDYTECAIWCGAGYYLNASGGSNGTTPFWQSISDWGTVTATGLTPDTEYCFWVRAKNGDGVLTSWSNPGCGKTLIMPDPCEGNFDNDGDVDGSDLAVFAADFGRTDCDTGPACEGDFDHDGDVDGSDLAVFAADFGRTDCPH